MAQSVKHPTLCFDSGHDLRVRDFKVCTRLCVNSEKADWDFLSSPLSAPPLLTLCLFLKNKEINLEKKFLVIGLSKYLVS